MEFVRVKKFSDTSFNEKKSKFKDENVVQPDGYIGEHDSV